MSWIDLLALTLTLWTAVKGYVRGAFVSLCFFIATAAAIVTGTTFHPHLFVYLNKEWQAVEIVSVFIANQVTVVSASFSQGSTVEFLPPLAERALLRIAPELAVVYVVGRESPNALLSNLAIRFFCVAALFVIASAFGSLLIRINKQKAGNSIFGEKYKVIGLTIGMIHGVLISVIVCIVLDAVSCIALFVFLQQDLRGSYLYQISVALIQNVII